IPILNLLLQEKIATTSGPRRKCRTISISSWARLFLADQRAGLSNAALHEGRFDFQFLVGSQVDHGFERKITGQCKPHTMLSRGKQHGLADAVKLIDVSCELFIDEYRGPGRGGRDFQFPGGIRRWATVVLH